jgi:5-methylcytosine-specific restriction enzyme subunit McrC
VRHAGIRLHQHALDIGRDPVGLLAEIASLSRQMGTDLPV